jgi:ParB-like chromosome segregation protein Spo0J
MIRIAAKDDLQAIVVDNVARAAAAGVVLKNHSAADHFPMMDEERYAELKESLREHGFFSTESIKITTGGLVLDGRARLKACVELGIEARFEVIDGNPFTIAWALNGKRRDLGTDQRAVIYQFIMQASDEWESFNDKVAAEANRKRREAALARERNADGTLASAPSTRGQTGRDHDADAATAKAKASSTNRPAIERAAKLIKEAPQLAYKVAVGEMRSTEAHRLLKKAKIANRLRRIGKAMLWADDLVEISTRWPEVRQLDG